MLCTAACLYVRWQAYQTRKNAEILLIQLRTMKVGSTTLREVQELAVGSQSRFLAKGVDPFCKDEFCTYSFGYYTGVLGKLSFWRLHPWRLSLTPAPVAFSANVTLQRDRLVRIEMLLTSDVIPRTVSATVDDEVLEVSPVLEPYVYRQQPFLYGVQSSQISVYVKPSATMMQREAAYSFNLSCMDKFGGCHSPAELLPGAESVK